MISAKETERCLRYIMDNESAPRTPMHHYLPASFLKRFADSEGFLHVLDFHDRKLFKAKPAKVARIRDFYTAETIDTPEHGGVERMLSLVEDKAVPVVGQIIEENRIPIGTDDWEWLCAFIALLDRRVPIAREAFNQTADIMFNLLAESMFGTQQGLESTLKEIEAETGTMPDIDLETARQFLDEGCISAEVPQNLHIRTLLESAQMLAPLITKMTPHLVISDEADFVTGDCPLAKWNRQPNGIIPGVGWALPTTEVALPIGRRHCVFLTWDSESHVLKADRDMVANVNHEIAEWAMRYVLSPRDRFLWMDHDKSLRTGTKLLIRRLGAAKVGRQVVHVSPSFSGSTARARSKGATRPRNSMRPRSHVADDDAAPRTRE